MVEDSERGPRPLAPSAGRRLARRGRGRRRGGRRRSDGPVGHVNRAEPDPANARWRALLDEGGPILADGAMGTMLFSAGLQFGDPPEVWNVSQPEVVRRIHRGYLEAGLADRHDEHVRRQSPPAPPPRPRRAGRRS